ncbi:interactor of constitutive active ROPs 2, chloroplastic [Punica granatum]|uniref:Interactor of constitutive active ROPs 2, chloroplastic n=1 Tax=Punica granatum TaxID=22663 RepID=A0A6P8CDU4_PUNGR|nr:interactor of constitutive active ROPs 2, chloroplastic [Punica granatum]XP_031382134.1 interactor of constitutive active ROPs 2, chloroplastic [Punica granatum]XP_031382135.1 interactor of constitutive active ROPs 2, chloroplastic [Punica granatum]XP_031382136.1 interactor of constitutive active ROPs 2, chloroplastic [Punica granatum]XP_031382137.1 interactor of constitutive active ROPs 2, chloroplastic [Punica granatum]
MQTPKARTNSSDVPHKKSPGAARTARQLKTPGSDSEAMSSSPNAVSKTPKDKSPKVSERKSPRTPVSEKKRPNRMSELESQLSQLQEDLKIAKDQLASSESAKRQAQKEAEEAKYRLSLLSQKLGESQQQLMDLSASEEDRVQELRKISQDRDRAWQSELEAVQNQHSMDSAALTSALNEIKKLRAQLEKVAESEAAQSKHAELAHNEIQRLRLELSETLTLVEKLRTELGDCRESEAQALEVVRNTERQLEIASVTAETLRSECIKVSEAYDAAKMELERSNDRMKELEALVSKLQEEPLSDNIQSGEIDQLKDELNSVKNEAGQLRSALDAAEMRYQEEYIQSTLQIRSAYEQMENTRKESSQRQALLEEELKKAMSRIEELGLVSLTKLETKSEIEESPGNENEHSLMSELERLRADLSELKAELSDRDTKLKNLSSKNEVLKKELSKREMESTKVNNEAVALAEAMKGSEREALTRVESLREEADKSNRRVERVMEQLDAAQAANLEMEAELRRLKVQSDQWRKAAEAAAAMISSGGENNGKLMERASSLDNYYSPVAGNVMGSPYSEDMEEESPKKRNGNVLMKKIGVLWKKGQK